MTSRRLRRSQEYVLKHQKIVEDLDCPYDKKPCDSFLFVGGSGEEPYLRLCNVVSSFEKNNIEKTVNCHRFNASFFKQICQ